MFKIWRLLLAFFRLVGLVFYFILTAVFIGVFLLCEFIFYVIVGLIGGLLLGSLFGG